MTRGEKWGTAAAVVGGVVILYFLLHRSGAIAPGWTINVPPLAPPIMPAPVNYQINLNYPVNANPPGSGSSCGCDGSNPLYSSFAALISAATGNYVNIEQSYFNSILASFPAYFAQDLNNVEGARLSESSKAIFSSL